MFDRIHHLVYLRPRINDSAQNNLHELWLSRGCFDDIFPARTDTGWKSGNHQGNDPLMELILQSFRGALDLALVGESFLISRVCKDVSYSLEVHLFLLVQQFVLHT